MIIRCIKTGRYPAPTFSFFKNKIEIASAFGGNNARVTDVTVFGMTYVLPYDVHGDIDATGNKINLVSDITNTSNTKLGRIYPVKVGQKKWIFFSKRYEYDVIELLGKSLSVYEIGLGADKHFVNFYENDVLVAVIFKDDKVVNYSHTYTIYAESDQYLDILCVYNMYFHYIRFNSCEENAVLHNGNTETLTPEKELQEKYDPTFIPRIKSMEGITE